MSASTYAKYIGWRTSRYGPLVARPRKAGQTPNHLPRLRRLAKLRNARERHKHQPSLGPRWVARHPPEIRHLGIRVSIGYDDGGAGEQRAILHLRRGSREGDPKNQEML